LSVSTFKNVRSYGIYFFVTNFLCNFVLPQKYGTHYNVSMLLCYDIGRWPCC